jgi:excisionase family DNA binding protein
MPAAARIADNVEKLLYSRNEAAYALGISSRSIDRMIAGQVLPTRRLGSRVVIPASAVKSLAEQVLRQDMLGPIGAPISKRQLRLIHRNSKHEDARSAPSAQEVPEEGARRLRGSAR